MDPELKALKSHLESLSPFAEAHEWKELAEALLKTAERLQRGRETLAEEVDHLITQLQRPG